jgi:CsoR family transcriptional regulator, copper-sensing transcriptional repressor
MNEANKREIVNRLKSVEGHIRGVLRMVDEDQYCIDIIKQIVAVQRALDKVNDLILDNHLNTCVTMAIQGDDPSDRQRVIHELLDVFETTHKL